MDLKNIQISVIGLGYVGLPLAVEFGKIIPTIGYDINTQRLEELKQASDRTLEVSSDELQQAKNLSFSSEISDLMSSNVFIVTVPTPIDDHKVPDLSTIKSATEIVGKALGQGDVVIYESTVYPGVTEDICVPILEAESNLKFNQDYFVGYSPERINPGDKEHRLPSIIKVTSGSTPEAAEFVDQLYRKIITAGTHKASSIKVAEAAKVIENTQRDVNIALINELSLIFNRLEIDTLEVLEAAGTKWNFLQFRPGLVGGHCIGVDPYYLTHKAQEIGYNPEVILSGRRINDGMGPYVAESVIKLMTRKKIHTVDSKILILGFTFKENCPDFRNTRVIDIVREFDSYHAQVEIYDPWIDTKEAEHQYTIPFLSELPSTHYDAIILAVNHNQFKELGADKIHSFGKQNHVLFDVKNVLTKEQADGRL
ncbi:MAG: Vi polysaccharide biosynthesis UDP-N-acetylglucosamine C-6 dehydrogenase TviB [Gammaproteobacteria bacterium]|nr:Vi polysaccharide biosynthesis UDP-N-acetylglucosamine C-6 dehydrogenase TviB [Gammaproteobacteria bacterium]